VRISEVGLDLIRDFETLRLEAYLDSALVPTIGWGHTKGVSLGTTCTEAEADAWLAEDVLEHEEIVTRSVEVEINQGMYDALVSVSFNAGALWLAQGEPSRLLRLVNAREWGDAGVELVKWHHAGGKELRGLCRRRAAELVLFHRDRWPKFTRTVGV